MSEVKSYKEYLLRDEADIEPIRKQIGEEKFLALVESVGNYMNELPGDGTWVDYLADVPEKKRPTIVKVFCYAYNRRPLNPFDFINFNNQATMLRHIKAHVSPYDEYFKDKSNGKVN